LRNGSSLSDRLCDEIGLLAYQENYASWRMEPSPKLAERFNRSTLAMVKRDRNHPSVVIWGILNETPKGPVAAQGAATLPLVRALDDTRVVMLNSGDWDGSGKTIANRASRRGRPPFPTSIPTNYCRTTPRSFDLADAQRRPEAGLALRIRHRQRVGLTRLARHYEQWEKTRARTRLYRGFLDRFMADWQRWNLGDTFANPETTSANVWPGWPRCGY